MSRRDTPHVVVVGAGIVGASVAGVLSRRGGRVTVLDAGGSCGGISSVSFSWINAVDKSPRHYRDLNRLSMAMWGDFAERLGAGQHLSRGGEIRWVTTADARAQLVERVRIHQSQGYPIRLLDGDQIRRMEPSLTTGDVAAASFAEADGHVDVDGIVAASLESARHDGAMISLHTPVTGFRRLPGRRPPIAVCSGAEAIPADVIVLAAGAGNDFLVEMLGAELPLQKSFGATVVTKPLPRLFRRVAIVQTPRDKEPRVSIRQLPDGRVMMHGLGPPGQGSLGKSDDEVDLILRTAAATVPALSDAVVDEVRTGQKPVPEGALPVLGFLPRSPEVYIASAHNAVTLAPAIASMAAIEILDSVPVDHLEPYRIDRFNG